jgi:putative chitinase
VEVSRLAATLTGVGAQNPDRWATVLAPAMNRHAITNDARAVCFLSNVLHETAGFRSFCESLNYGVPGLLKTFGRHRISAADARRLGRQPGEKCVPLERQAEIANILYGGEFGRKQLGNTQPEDGWYFRGRGLIQLTGRANHTRLAKTMGIDVVKLQAMLDTDEGSAESAAHFFEAAGCNALADAGSDEGARRRINGGTLGMDDVLKWRDRLLSALPDPVVS